MNLPGFPDDASHFHDDRARVALANPRSVALDAFASRPAVLRQAVWRLPDRARPGLEATTWAIAVAVDGAVVNQVRGDTPL
ncbi:MAG: hypothetical protein EON52_16005 [Actinomycetales bacterium]|nr:MAG: hypothetical protein EON52_16005 [Actinomycetales bacterium]